MAEASSRRKRDDGGSQQAAKRNAGGAVTATDAKPLRSMHALLRSMGVDQYEPRVIHQLLEYAQQYTTEIFIDSLHLADHAGRAGQLDCEDMLLSVRLKEKASQAAAPTGKLMDWMARTANKQPITPVTMPGIILPQPKYCLVEENWQHRPPVPPPPPAEAAAQHAPAQPPPDGPSRPKIAINLTGPVPMSVDGE